MERQESPPLAADASPKSGAETPESNVYMDNNSHGGRRLSSTLSTQSSISESMGNLGHGRYDASNQRSLIALKLPSYLAVAALILLLILKSGSHAGQYFVLNKGLHISNSVFGGLLFLFLGTYFFCWVWRVYVCWQTGKTWSHRRLVAVRNNAARAVVMLVILALYAGGNMAVLVRPGYWCSGNQIGWIGFFTWTCWNILFVSVLYDAHCQVLLETGDRKDSSVRDQPLIYHWPKLLMWCVVQGFLVWTIIQSEFKEVINVTFPDPSQQVCTWGTPLKCSPNRTIVISTGLIVLGFGLYWLLSVVCLVVAWRQVHKRPYLDYKVMHTILRLQIRNVMSFTIVIATAVLLWLVGPDSCANYALSWFGMVPMMIVMTGIIWLGLYLTLPRHPASPPPKINELYQQFAWTEASKASQIEKRNTAFMNPKTHNEPMFCMETCIKLFYWSALIYDFTEAEGHTFNALPETIRELLGEVEQAMSFYNLVERRLFYDRSLETKILSAWSDRTIVISIRGSIAAVNFVADAQFLQTAHPPRRHVDGRVARVHKGFLKTWQAGGINELLIEHVEQLLQSAEDRDGVQILLTGHSLGGAVATLAAYDIVKKCKLRSDQVTVYTFGCPRVGNRAFAKDFGAVVPDAWGIINDQDLVCRGMKLYGLYKRAGHRVLLNGAGDLIIRPSLFELTLMQAPFRASAIHHNTANYQAALHSVLRNQMDKSKRNREGLSGVLELLNAAPIVHEALDMHARNLGTNLADQIRSLSMVSYNGVTGSMRVHSIRTGSRMSRHNSALEAALAEVPDVRNSSGHIEYEPVYEGPLTGPDASDDEVSSAAANSVDSVVVEMPSSAAEEQRQRRQAAAAAGPPPPVGPHWRQVLTGARQQSLEAAAAARQVLDDIVDDATHHVAVPIRSGAQTTTAPATSLEKPVAAAAPRRAGGGSARWRSALHMTRKSRKSPSDAPTPSPEPAQLLQARASARQGGVQGVVGIDADSCRVRKCYIIPEEDWGADSVEAASAAEQAASAPVTASAPVNGAMPQRRRVCTRWQCPLTAAVEDLPSNATLEGNIVSIGSKPNMRACRGLKCQTAASNALAAKRMHLAQTQSVDLNATPAPPTCTINALE